MPSSEAGRMCTKWVFACFCVCVCVCVDIALDAQWARLPTGWHVYEVGVCLCICVCLFVCVCAGAETGPAA